MRLLTLLSCKILTHFAREGGPPPRRNSRLLPRAGRTPTSRCHQVSCRVLGGARRNAIVCPLIREIIRQLKLRDNPLFTLFFLLLPMIVYCPKRGGCTSFIPSRPDGNSRDRILRKQGVINVFSCSRICTALLRCCSRPRSVLFQYHIGGRKSANSINMFSNIEFFNWGSGCYGENADGRTSTRTR